MGLGYEALHAKHPRLIYTSISGFGHTGPLRERAGYDAVLQGEAGIMSLTGPPDGCGYKVGVAIADLAAGLFAAQGTLLALYARERTGCGQHVDIAMLDSVAALLTYQAGIYFVTGRAAEAAWQRTSDRRSVRDISGRGRRGRAGGGQRRALAQDSAASPVSTPMRPTLVLRRIATAFATTKPCGPSSQTHSRSGHAPNGSSC